MVDSGSEHLLSEDERWRLVERVAASNRFQKSPQLRKFLLFICKTSLAGKSDEIRERVIGHYVCGRAPNYDAGADNIVRVEARRLRMQLEHYFSLEGQDEPLVINLPKGTYVPTFQKHRPQPNGQETTAVTASQHSAPEKQAGRRLPLGVTTMVGILALGFALGSVTIGIRGHPARATANVPFRKNISPPQSIWPVLFDPQLPTVIVIPDASLAMVEQLEHQRLPLSDYANHTYSKVLRPHGISEVFDAKFTGEAALRVITRITRSQGFPVDLLSVHFARNMSIRDFQSGNCIFLGDENSDPWTGLFRSQRNFVPEVNSKSWISYYRNLHPEPGEQMTYVSNPIGGTEYADVVYLPNLNHNGNVLILEGNEMAGTEAAFHFVSTSGSFISFLKQKGLWKDGKARYFEILLRTDSVNNMPVKITPITYRAVSVSK